MLLDKILYVCGVDVVSLDAVRVCEKRKNIRADNLLKRDFRVVALHHFDKLVLEITNSISIEILVLLPGFFDRLLLIRRLIRSFCVLSIASGASTFGVDLSLFVYRRFLCFLFFFEGFALAV